MMTMKNPFHIFATILVLLSASCIKDLDTMPLNEDVFAGEQAWQDTASYEKLLSKIYAGLALSGNSGAFGVPDLSAADQGEATFLRSYWNMQQLCTDEVVCSEDNESMRGLQFMQWNSTNHFISLNYTRIYLNIAYANEFLRETTYEKLSSRNLDDAMKNRIQGFRNEARVLRAMNYYFLMDLYANVPFIDETFPIGENKVEQKGREFFFQWIESELRSAEGKLPPADKIHYGMVNDATVRMILSKMYLNSEIWVGKKMYDQCLTEIEKVISENFSLDDRYAEIFCADNHLSPEIIFPIIYDGRRAATFGGTTYLIAASSKSDMNPTSTRGFSQAWSNIRALEPLSDRFDANDSRAMFWKENRTRETDIWYDFTNGWSVVKYSNLNSDGTVGSNTSHADTDFPLFRLADAYLIYAEAVLRGAASGSRDKAISYINALRDRAGADRITEIDLTLDFLLDERSRELYWEGHRRTDLIRFDRFTDNYNWPWKNGVHVGVMKVDDKFSIYPIPSTEVTVNPYIIQNAGY